MRKRFLLPLLVLLMTTLSTHAYDFKSGDLYYNITGENTVAVTYQLYESRANYQGLTTATIPETVTYNGTTYSVTSIEKSAFRACSSLTSITIPNSVTSIGYDAFMHCESLTSITIPNSVTSIGQAAFYNCYKLTSITIPNSVTSIGDEMFYGCTSLTSLTIPNSVTSIGDVAFKYCSSLASITIPNSVTSIGNNAFEYCKALTSITIPNSVTSIGYDAFMHCESLTSITIPNSVTSIGYEAFSYCYSLTSITIPNSVTSIRSSTFRDCFALTSITIPESVTSIGGYAFEYCKSLTSITIPESVTSIGDHAFEACYSLTSITIPNSVTSIGSYAFEACYSLTSITIPNSVTSIGERAFEYCESLTTVTSMSCTPPDCGSSVFYDTPSEKTLVVPNSSLDAYKSSSPWKTFTTFESIVYPTLSVQSANALMGTAHIDQEVDCDSIAIISAVSNLGYAFTQWTDGNTDNPRTVLITQDTLFTAEFGLAYSGKCGDDLYWEYSDKALSITGNSTMYDFSTSTIPWLLLCDSIQNITIGDDVRSIGSCAFQGCSSLTSITIPNKVLVNVDILNPNAVYFVNMKGWSNIHVHAWGGTKDGTTWPGEIATKADFTYQGYDIYYFTAPPGDYEYCIFNNGFSGTSNQTENLVWTGGQAYFNDEWHTIQGDLSYKVAIGANAFRGCSSLTSITIPNSVTSIGDCAFYDCSSLTSITIPNSVTSIGKRAFAYCSSLPVVDNVRYADTYLVEAVDKSLSTHTIKAGTKWIGDYAFYKCSSLTSITIPNSVTTIGNYAFDGCTALTSVVWNAQDCKGWTDAANAPFRSSREQITSFTFGNQVETIPAYLCDSMVNIKEINIPNSATTIGNYAFDGCTALTSVVWNAQDCKGWTDAANAPFRSSREQITSFTFGNHVETIPAYLCDNMVNIKEINIPNSVKTIREGVFNNNVKLAKVTIGTSVETIEANAFAGCRRLYDIYCYPTYPPLAETNSFANYNVYVYVPCENQRDYTLDVVWGEFKFIECIGSEVVVLPDDTVTVSPNYEDATFIWPVTDGADTYALVITKDGVTFCTLVFNAQGQLVSIAFKPRRQNAPAEEGTTPATYAEMTANGFRFKVTGLDEGSAYAYTFTVRNAANSVLETYTGEFTTLSNTPTGINESASEDACAPGQAEKILRNGQVLILRNGETYDMMGQRL